MGSVRRRQSSFKASKYGVLIGLVLAIFIISIIDFVIVEKKSLPAAVLETACTALYTDCSRSEALSTKAVHVLLGLTTISVLVLLVSEGVDYLVKNALEGGGKMKEKIKELNNHIIVCGYGELGKTVCSVLDAEGQDYVVIDLNPKIIEKLHEDGVVAVEGDALDSKVLHTAGISRARRIISALNTDSANVFLTLTAKEINSKIAIATRAYAETAVSKLHRAGADIIVMPEIIGGMELAKEVLDIEEMPSRKIVSKQK